MFTYWICSLLQTIGNRASFSHLQCTEWQHKIEYCWLGTDKKPLYTNLHSRSHTRGKVVCLNFRKGRELNANLHAAPNPTFYRPDTRRYAHCEHLVSFNTKTSHTRIQFQYISQIYIWRVAFALSQAISVYCLWLHFYGKRWQTKLLLTRRSAMMLADNVYATFTWTTLMNNKLSTHIVKCLFMYDVYVYMVFCVLLFQSLSNLNGD